MSAHVVRILSTDEPSVSGVIEIGRNHPLGTDRVNRIRVERCYGGRFRSRFCLSPLALTWLWKHQHQMGEEAAREQHGTTDRRSFSAYLGKEVSWRPYWYGSHRIVFGFSP